MVRAYLRWPNNFGHVDRRELDGQPIALKEYDDVVDDVIKSLGIIGLLMLPDAPQWNYYPSICSCALLILALSSLKS